QLDAETGADLVKAGIVAEATEEDVDGKPEEEQEDGKYPVDQEAAVTRAVTRLSRDIESSISKGVQVAMGKANKFATQTPAIAATVKKDVFQDAGEFYLTMTKAYKGDDTAKRKLHAHNAENYKIKSPLGANEGNNLQGGYFLKPTYYDDVVSKQ